MLISCLGGDLFGQRTARPGAGLAMAEGLGFPSFLDLSDDRWRPRKNGKKHDDILKISQNDGPSPNSFAGKVYPSQGFPVMI